jgi:LacI family transcriptional regulator
VGKRATIKDIARLAKVSLGSVHCALLGKEGVSEKTRLRILNIARQIDYRPNSSASALKRRQLQIGAAFPGVADDSRFYYAGIWQGIRDYFNAARDLNISCVELPFAGGGLGEPEKDTEMDGLLTVGYLDHHGAVSLKGFIDRHIPVVLVTNDLPLSGRLCCVEPEYHITGRMLAEFITRQIPAGADILVWAGDRESPSHSATIKGFDSYMADKQLPAGVRKIYSGGTVERDRETLVRALGQKNHAACCCVNARGSVLLGEAVTETGLAGGIVSVGSDIFKENLRFLDEDVFTALVHKNTYLQAYLAAKCLVEYLVKDIPPPAELIHVGSEIVIQSSAPMCRNGFSQLSL